MTPAKPRPATPSRRRMAEPPAAVMVVASELTRVVRQGHAVKPPAAAVVAVVFECDRSLFERARSSHRRPPWSLSPSWGGLAFRERAVEPSAAVMIVSERGQVAIQEQAVKPPASTRVASVGGHEPASITAIRERVTP